MKNMVETTAGANLVTKAVFAICAFILAIVLLPVGTAHAASYSIPSDAQASGTSGGCTWYIASASDASSPGQLVIYPTNGASGTLGELSGGVDGAPWYEYRELPLSIYVAEGVQTGVEARHLFSKLSNVTTADVHNLIFPESTKRVGGMFDRCTSLESVNIKGWDISNVESVSNLFDYCASLMSIDLSGLDTSNVEAFSGLFRGCSSLKTVDMSPLDMSSAQTIASMFDRCTSLESVEGLSGRAMPDLNSLNTMFNGCTNLESIDVSGWTTGNVTTFSLVFADCANLKSIVGLDTWDTSSGTRFYGMFDGCSSIESIDVSNFNTGNADSLELMFADCTSLKSLDLSGFATSKVTSFYSFLKGCENITSLDLSSFDTSSATKMERFFYGMNRLSEVTLGASFNFAGDGSTFGTLPTPNPDYIAGATGKWQAVGSGTVTAPAGTVYAPADVPSNVAETYVPEKAKAPVLAEKGTWYAGSTAKSAITTINIVDSYTPKGTEKESWDASEAQDGSVTAYVSADGKTLTLAGNGYGRIYTTENASQTFLGFSGTQAIANAGLLDLSAATNVSEMLYNCSSLTSIDVSTWDVSNVVNMSYMFNNCKALDGLDVSEWDTSSVTNMASVFTACESVTELDVSKWDTSNVLTFSATFFNCPSLTSIDVSNFDTGKAKNFSSMFMNSTGLTSIDVSNFDTSNATNLSAMFDNTGIKTMDISMLDTSNVTDFSRVFHNCDSLKTVVFGNIDTSNVVTMSSLFDNCESLESVDLANLNTANVQDFSGMFKSCKSLEELDLSHFNTAKGTNFEKVFYLCYDLEVLNIESWNTMSATKMTDMFASCRTLQQVTLGEGFSFTGNGSASCVLPTPDAKYINDATGNWQAVGSGTVSAPAGTVYAPADVPSNVAETYVMEAPKIPVLAEWNSWYKGSTAKADFTTVNIVDSYSPTGSETESWDASAEQNGSVMAYVSADGKTLTLAGNGYGSIIANEFSMGVFESFESVTAFNGLGVLDMSKAKTIQGFFSSCRSVKSLDLSMWDTSSLGAFDGTEGYPDTDMYGVFSGCYALESLNVSGWDVDDVECMAFLFSDCQSLKTIDLSSWDPKTLERADWLFSACQSLQSVKGITGWGSEGKITRVDHLFYNCWALESVDLSDWNVSNCVDMNRMFYYDYVLESVCFDGWDTSSCEDFSMMVYECPVINNLDVSGFDTSSADEYGLRYFAYNCFGLDNIILGSNFGTADQAAQGWIFYVNTEREDVADRFPSGYLETTVTGANAIMEFGAYDWTADNRAPKKAVPVLAPENTWYKGSTDKSTFTAINIVDSYVPTGSEKESWDASEAQDGSVMAYVSADGKTLTLAGNGSGCLKANANSNVAFDEFASVTAISGLALLDTSDVLQMFGFFADNACLTSVTGIENWDVSKCLTFSSCFSECYALTSIDLSKWDMSSAETISCLVYDCDNLVNLKTPTILAKSLTVANHAFDSCEKLESVDVSFMCSGILENIVGLFQSCESLKTIVGYQTLVTSATEEISAIFNCCESIEYLDVSKWVTNNVTLIDLSFASTYSLSTIDGLENWNVGNVEDMSSTFRSSWVTDLDGISGWDVSSVETFDSTFCAASELTYLDLSSWSTDAAEDMGRTFYRCSDLMTLKLGPGFSTGNVVDFIGFLADCRNLRTLDISMVDTTAAADMTDFFAGMDRLQQVTLGEKFSFTGNGSTSCVLPTPDPAYITGAIGKWQAVGAGTVEKPAGTIYLPADVPSKVAETYVMPLTTISVDVPVKVTLAAASDGTWCTPSAAANQIVNHSMAPVKVVSAKAAASDGFSMLAAANVKSSTKANVFGGTIKAGTGTAQDLTAISTSGDAWTMAAATASDDSDLISLQLAGSIGNVEGKYFTGGCKLFDITYTFELAL